MAKFIKNFRNKFYYSIESIKNRYPCKIIKIRGVDNFQEGATVTYRAVTNINIRESSPKEILDDPLLIEKFHPTDCVKLSFLAAGEILFKKTNNLAEAKELYKKITTKMFIEINPGEQNDP